MRETNYINRKVINYSLNLRASIENFYNFNSFLVNSMIDYIIRKMEKTYGHNADEWQDFGDKSEFEDIIDEMGLFLLTCV
jgi:hypothetical protein